MYSGWVVGPRILDLLALSYTRRARVRCSVTVEANGTRLVVHLTSDVTHNVSGTLTLGLHIWSDLAPAAPAATRTGRVTVSALTSCPVYTVEIESLLRQASTTRSDSFVRLAFAPSAAVKAEAAAKHQKGAVGSMGVMTDAGGNEVAVGVRGRHDLERSGQPEPQQVKRW